MLKIGTPQELSFELRHLIRYATEGTPSRSKIAFELRELAERTDFPLPSW